jgi:hypothetical protein
MIWKRSSFLILRNDLDHYGFKPELFDRSYWKSPLSFIIHLSKGFVSHLSIYLSVCLSISLSMALQPFVGPWPLFQFLILYIVVRAPWNGDQPVARPIPTHRTTQRINAHTVNHTSIGIRTHDPSVRGERRRFMSQTEWPLWSSFVWDMLRQLNCTRWLHTYTELIISSTRQNTETSSIRQWM